MLEDLPYIPYERGRKPYATPLENVIYFRVQEGAEFPLSQAVTKDEGTLIDGEQPAFPPRVSSKISIQLQVSGWLLYLVPFCVWLTSSRTNLVSRLRTVFKADHGPPVYSSSPAHIKEDVSPQNC